MKFSLIIPCYNEAANIPLLLDRCKKLTKNSSIEVIIVDNGSNDDTPNVLLNLLPNYPGCRSVRVSINQGYGFGIISGLREAQGDILGWTHADLQTDPCDFLTAITHFQNNGNNIFVKGRRYGRPMSDKFFTFGMSVFESILLKTTLWDINAQPTLFSKQFFDSWKEAPHDFSLDLYAYYKAKKQGLTVHRLPVHFGERAHGISHWNINWKAKIKFIQRTIKYSLNLRKQLHSN